LLDCTRLLVDTVISYPALAADSSVSSGCVTALSLALQLGSALPAQLVNNVSTAMNALSAGVVDSLVLGEDVQTLISDNVRVSSQLLSSTSLSADAVFTTPKTSIEELTNTNTNVPSISLDIVSDDDATASSSSSTVSVSIVYYTGNVLNSSSTTSTSVGLSVIASDSTASSPTRSRRRLDSYTSGSSVLVTLPNSGSIDYVAGSVAAENRTATCASSTTPYTIMLACSQNRSYQHECNSSISDSAVPYTCPAINLVPVCSTWDGTSFVSNPYCTVVSFSQTFTVCRCYSGYATYSPLSSSPAISAVDEASTSSSSSGNNAALVQFAGVATAVGDNFVDTISSVTKLNASDIKHNALMFSIMCALIGLFFIGFMIVLRVDYNEIDNVTNSQHLAKKTTTDFNSLLASAIPTDLAPNVSWYSRLWRLLKLQHDFIGLWAPYMPEGIVSDVQI
jgi:hypothetical protein